MSEHEMDRQVRRRLAIFNHAEEVTGNVAPTCRYYGINPRDLLHLEAPYRYVRNRRLDRAERLIVRKQLPVRNRGYGRRGRLQTYLSGTPLGDAVPVPDSTYHDLKWSEYDASGHDRD